MVAALLQLTSNISAVVQFLERNGCIGKHVFVLFILHYVELYSEILKHLIFMSHLHLFSNIYLIDSIFIQYSSANNMLLIFWCVQNHPICACSVTLYAEIQRQYTEIKNPFSLFNKTKTNCITLVLKSFDGSESTSRAF